MNKFVFLISLIFALGSVFAGTQARAQAEELKLEVIPNDSKPEATPAIVVLSFLDWKALRVHEAQQKLEKASREKGTESAPIDSVGKTFDSQKLNFNVDVALQLNIQDYFSMYLKTLTAAEFQEATKKLTHLEVYELLQAYKASLESPKAPTLKFSKADKK